MTESLRTAESLVEENIRLREELKQLQEEKSILQKIKKPELKAVASRAEKQMSAEDSKVIASSFMMLDVLEIAYNRQKKTVSALMKTFFGPHSEKVEKASTNTEEKEKKQGHNNGRNSSAQYTGAERIKVKHSSLKSGDSCPECLVGKVYNQEPSPLIRIDGTTPIIAKIYELEKLRCNMCGKIFKAEAPANVGEEKYNENAKAMIAMLKYGIGVPSYRLENMQNMLGIPLPDATQWDIIETLANDARHAYCALFMAAADANLFKTDDTGVKIMSLINENKTGNPDRKGMQTSCILAELEENIRVCLYFSGRKHSGENFGDMLKNRSNTKSTPIQMSDALAVNTPKLYDVISAFCLAHGRRNFFKIKEDFPDECGFVIKKIGEVYEKERETKEMTPQARLLYHKKHSAPLMQELEKWFYRKLKKKEIEPNSTLGKAVNYMQKHWSKLTTFLREPGVPLDNNECERAIKNAILYRKNSMIYKNEVGSNVGDIFMSVIETCVMNNANPFDYLVEIQKNRENLKSNPENWMPWNYKNNITEKTI